MPGRTLTISVVICTYSRERRANLLAVAASVLAQTRPPHEMIVVVDHNPALLDDLHRALPAAIVVANAGPPGLSAARNSGIAAASGEVIAFIDDDAVAVPNWLERLGLWYAAEGVVGVGGPVRPLWLTGRPAWFPEEFEWVVGCSFRGMPTEARPVQRLIGCNMSFRREVFDQIGGFRHGLGRVGSYPVAGEETELSIKIGQRWPERRLIYDPWAVVLHRVPDQRATFSYFRTRSFCEGLSKARMAAQVGHGDALTVERAYATRVLPAGVVRGLVDLLGGDPGGIGRAGAIVAGLAITLWGYLRGLRARPGSPVALGGDLV